jgi:hypothetical protein
MLLDVMHHHHHNSSTPSSNATGKAAQVAKCGWVPYHSTDNEAHIFKASVFPPYLAAS